MGYVLSSVSEIEKFRFIAFPKNGWKNWTNIKLVNVGRCIFIIKDDNHNAVYTDHSINKNMALTGTGSDYIPLIALCELGLITKKQLEKHGERKRIENEALDIAEVAISKFKVLEKASIELTPQQKRKITMLKKITKKNLEDGKLPHWFRKNVEKSLETADQKV